jgi:hypothetical protein
VLLLGAFKNGKLQYVGRVGTGFPRDVLASLYRKFQLLKRKQPSVEDLPRTQRATFLSPKLVAQISYTEWAKDGRLRHPVFLGLRHDKMLKMLRCLRPNENQMAKKFPVAVSHGDRVFGIVPIQGQCLQRFGTGTDNDHSRSNLGATKLCGASNAGAAPVTISTHVSTEPYDTRNGGGMHNDRFQLGRGPPRSLAWNTRSTGSV